MDPAQTISEEKYEVIKESIKSYSEQLRQSWSEVSSIDVPVEYNNCKNVVVCGMGGSALGARMVDHLIIDRVRTPIEIFTEYHIPHYAFNETLLIVSSYSGNTEETLSCANEALTRGVKLFGITTGGQLGSMLEERNVPRYIFDPKNNHAKVPRMSIGYASGAILSLLSKLKYFHLPQENIENTIKTMKGADERYGKSDSHQENLAMSQAEKIKGKIPILVGSEHLKGVLHTIKNQFNESAKTFSMLFDLPELNHHLMEGLQNPKSNKGNLYFVFFESDLYTDRVQKRYPVTYEVLNKNSVEYSVYRCFSSVKLEQLYEVLIFGSYVVYYLTKLYGIDPTVTPWVDHFKEKLANS